MASLLLLFLLPLLALASDVDRPYRIALVSKKISSPFFAVSENGCLDAAQRHGVECLYTGPVEVDAQEQAQLITNLIEGAEVDGLAISVLDTEVIGPVIEQAVNAGIPVVTFDSDAPLSPRSAYIGTNNTFFGEQLGKVLKQLVPGGGTYAVVSAVDPNIMEREKGLKASLEGEGWTEISNSPSFMDGNDTLAMVQIEEFGTQQPTAIVPCMGAPMRADGWKPFVNKHPDITMVVADGMPNQLELLAENYAAGLVGQKPYEMGYRSVETLLDLLQGKELKGDFVGTNLLEHTNIPLVLPELVVDQNLIGDLRYVGFILFGLVFAMAVSFGLWMWINRGVRVVRVAQPRFLLMCAAGVALMAAAMLPLGLNDSQDAGDVAICMSTPWLAVLGFTLTFSALFAKTWRVNRIFHAQHGAPKPTEAEVLKPFLALLTANLVVLITWTAIDPLTYGRYDHLGTDGWNRIVSTYGTCKSNNVVPYMVLLAILNVGVLAVGNWHAYQTRMIKSEFSESKYIGMSMVVLLQSALTGVPLLFVVRDSPQAYYLITVFIIFCICTVILVLMFVPKIVFALSMRDMDHTEQRNLIDQRIQNSMEAYHNQGGSASFRITSQKTSSFAHPTSELTVNSQLEDGGAAKNLPVQYEEAEESEEEPICMDADCSHARKSILEYTKDSPDNSDGVRRSTNAGFMSDLERGRLSVPPQETSPRSEVKPRLSNSEVENGLQSTRAPFGPEEEGWIAQDEEAQRTVVFSQAAGGDPGRSPQPELSQRKLAVKLAGAVATMPREGAVTPLSSQTITAAVSVPMARTIPRPLSSRALSWRTKGGQESKRRLLSQGNDGSASIPGAFAVKPSSPSSAQPTATTTNSERPGCVEDDGHHSEDVDAAIKQRYQAAMLTSANDDFWAQSSPDTESLGSSASSLIEKKTATLPCNELACAGEKDTRKSQEG